VGMLYCSQAVVCSFYTLTQVALGALQKGYFATEIYHLTHICYTKKIWHCEAFKSDILRQKFTT